MKEIEDLHRKAMDLAERADTGDTGDTGDAPMLLRQAFDLERAAALLAAEHGVPQPSLGILYRSAASLALECGLLAEAKSLVDQALSAQEAMPEDLVAEIIELREELTVRTSTRSAP